MEKGSIVQIAFTGKDKLNNRVFDTTNEETAKKVGLVKENAVYKPITVVVGNNELIPGLEEELQQMKVGEKKTIEVSPKKAFGERRKEFVVVAPLQQFKKNKINPVPGLLVNIDGQIGKVQTVSGGRVRVDFNNELAGRTLEYELEVKKEFKTAEEKSKALVEKLFPFKDKQAEAKVSGKKLTIKMPVDLGQGANAIQKVVGETIKKHVKEVEEVVFEVPKSEEKKEKKEEGKAEKKEKESKK